MVTGFVLLFVMFSDIAVKVLGRRCLDCKLVSQPVHCNVVKECSSDENCYIEKFVTGGHSIFYDLGCRSEAVCRASIHNAFGKRDTYSDTPDKRETTVTCSDCCNSTDICNIGGQCGTNAVQQPSGDIYCFDCPHDTKHPEECARITLCKHGSSCYIRQTIDQHSESRWEHGCISQQECQVMTTSRNHTCISCCNSNFCNSHCNDQTSIETTTLTTTTTRPNTASAVLPTKPHNTHVQITPEQFHYGDNVKIVCQTTGHPNPYFVFLFKGSLLENNAHEIGNVLVILNYQQNDDGDYVCVANNAYGTDIANFKLQGTHAKRYKI